MTTIAYDHENGKIAVDGRTSRGGNICKDDKKKFVEDDGDIFFYTGSVCDVQEMISMIRAGDRKADGYVPDCTIIHAEALSVKVYQFDSDGWMFCEEIDCSDGFGSGGHWAVAAMDHGKSAKEAVEYAMTRDAYTGGKVFVFDLIGMEFIDG